MAIKVSGTTVINDSRALENITDIPNIIKTSFIESPTNGSTESGSGRFLTIDVSPFQAVFGVAETLTVQLDNNSDFSSPFYNVETTTSGSQVEVDSSQYTIPESTVVYCRARYKDADGNYSDWTATISFTTRSSFDYVNQPSITSPSASETGFAYEDPTFTSSAFSISGGSYTHTSSDWQVATDSNFATIVASTTDSTSSKTSWTATGTTLDNETIHYVRVRHNNSTLGDSDWSNTVVFTTSPLQGENVYTTPGSYSWVAPTGVTTVSAVVVGGGGTGFQGGDIPAGGGGGLAYKNNIATTPGTGYTVVVGTGGTNSGQNGSPSYFINSSTVNATGGTGSPSHPGSNNWPYPGGSNTAGDGGGDGGPGGSFSGTQSGAGGAGGYAGQGGRGGQAWGYTAVYPATAGAGGGGGGGWGSSHNITMGGGGGVGLFGQGPNGAAGDSGNLTNNGGKGGSGGTDGQPSGGPSNVGHDGGLYGGGGSGTRDGISSNCGQAGSGAVRVIWPGDTRIFPSTNVSQT